MFVGFVSMLLGLVLFGMARSTKGQGERRFTGGARLGFFAGGGLLMAFGLMLCVGRMIEWTDAVGAL